MNKFKLILNKVNNKKTENIFNINKISSYSMKKKILSEIRKCLINMNINIINKNFILFESVFVILSNTFYKENVIEYSISEIKFIKFILYLISFYLNKIAEHLLFLENKDNVNIDIKIFNLYNLNDILFSLEYLNDISLQDIYNKYFIKNIYIKINYNELFLTKELFFVLLILKLITSDNKNKNTIFEYFKEYNNLEKNNLIIDPILFFLLLLQNNKESSNINQNIKDNIKNLLLNLIEKKIKEATHNKIFKLIFLFYELINNNNIFNKELHIEDKIVVQYLEKEIIFFEKENISLFNLLFKIKNNKRNYNYIKYKENNNEDEKNIDTLILINLIKKRKKFPIFNSKIINDKFTYIFSIINNIIDILLLILNKIKNLKNNSYSKKNIIDVLLESNNSNNTTFNKYSYMIESKINNDGSEDYYSKENLSKLLQRFCVIFWIFNSFCIFVEEINKKYILENSKEIILISLLHIHFYYYKKYPNESPILNKEIIQYLNFHISLMSKQGNNISIKIKKIIEMYMDKDLLNKNFKNIFKDKNNLNKIFNSRKEITDENVEIYNYIKINDIQFEIYLNQFKTIFLNENEELLKCENDYILNVNNKIKNTKYYKKGYQIFHKYNKLIKYTKLIEIIGFDIPIHKNINVDDIHISKDNFEEYDPQIVFSIRKSLEKIFQNKDINNINNYIEIIPKTNNVSSSENNSTIINNNTLYSFNNNNNLYENKKEEEKNSIINDEEVKIELKQKKKFIYKTLANDINERKQNCIINQLYKSQSLNELMKRIKDKKNFNIYYNYDEEEIRYKYLAAKLLIKYFMNKKAGMNFFLFKKLKALYLVNQKNMIENQINIYINENEDE